MRTALTQSGDFVLCITDSAGNTTELVVAPLLELEKLAIQFCKEMDGEETEKPLLEKYPSWSNLPWEGADISAHSVEDVGRIYWFFEEKMMGKGHEVGFYSDEEVDTLSLMEDRDEGTDSH